MPDAQPSLSTIFLEVLDRAAPDDRDAYLDRVCGTDTALREQVEALLAAHAGAGRLPETDATRNFAATRPGPTDATGTFLPDEATGSFAAADPEATATYCVRPPARRATAVRREGSGTVIAGRYTLAEVIGEGGMGSVYLATQTEPVKRQVALKLIKAGMDSRTVLARFEAERQALALMDHPNIARMYDGGVTDAGQPFFVMELVHGVPLTEYSDSRRLSIEARLHLFVQVCHAVQHAHQKGIIHRDLKPGNVLVTEVDGRPTPKVIDFGVAKATEQRLTDQSFSDTGAIVGTPAYMSPEQADPSSVDIDTRTDVYALGVILYELLTGSPPIDGKQFKRGALLEMLRMVREVEPPRPSTKLSTADALPRIAADRSIEPAKLAKLLQGELDWVVMKALEKHRGRRYDTATGFAQDILRYLADEVVEARPPSRGYRLQKFVKRNRGQVVAAGLVLLALAGGIVGTSWGLVEANRARADERDRAEGERLAKVEAVEKEKLAVAQRANAEKARDRTRDVLDAMVSEVTGDSLATQKAISAEQKKFLESVLGYYREFAGANPDDEGSRVRQAEAAYRVGLIEYRLGRKEESAVAGRLARDGFASLAAQFPAVPSYRHRLARSHNNLGTLFDDLGKTAAAEEQFREELAIRVRLAADFPMKPEYRKELARNHANLGKLLTDQRRGDAAEEALLAALRIQEKLAADYPAESDYRRALARSHDSLGILYKSLNRRALEEEQYKMALAMRVRLVADFPRTPEYRADLAESHFHLAQFLERLSQPARAEEHFQKALVVQRRLAGEFPALPDYRADLAKTHNNLGNLLGNRGQDEAAAEQYRLAVAIFDKLAAEFPTVPEYRLNLAKSHTNVGIQLCDLGNQAAAEEHYRKAVAIREKLVADFPTVPDHRKGLALSHNNLGSLFTDLGRVAAAEEQLRKAVAIQEKLAAEFPAVTAYRIDLGGSCCNFGNLLRDGGKPAESLPWFDRAIDSLRPVLQKAPRNVTAKRFLRNSHWARAVAHGLVRAYSEAVADWDRAVEFSPPAEQPQLRAGRATAMLHAGQTAKAVAEVVELTKSPKWSGDDWYDFACVYAVGSGEFADKKAEYAHRAMELLRMAVKAGYKDTGHLKSDTDLDPLRERDDFKNLIAELEKKFPPKKEGLPAPRKG